MSGAEPPAALRAGWPRSLLGRLTLLMTAGVLLTLLAGQAIWALQLRAKAEADTAVAAGHLAQSAANAIRYFRSVPPAYRPLLIQQFREMGGTRFFVHLGDAPVAVPSMAAQPLADAALARVQATLRTELPLAHEPRLAFAWPDALTVSGGTRLTDLPEHWVRHILIVQPDPAPVLVIQTELEPGHWLYLASLMPDPYFLRAAEPLSLPRLLLQLLPFVVVLLLSALLVLRGITRPLAMLSQAATAFGRDEPAPALPRSGSVEVLGLARAFEAMRERIRKYLDDRERLFVSISHDLRTPITRLKLRTELLDDDRLRHEFEEDLDELDMMVKGALQSVKDSEIHEDLHDVRLDPLLGRLAGGARLGGREVSFSAGGLSVRAKPLALKRALGNLVDNALHYGERAEIAAEAEGDQVVIRIRDHGPGIAPEALATVFEPRMRLAHGRERNEGGLGLGLGIARSIVEAQGGRLELANHPAGGLVASVRLPAAPGAADGASS